MEDREAKKLYFVKLCQVDDKIRWLWVVTSTSQYHAATDDDGCSKKNLLIHWRQYRLFSKGEIQREFNFLSLKFKPEIFDQSNPTTVRRAFWEI